MFLIGLVEMSSRKRRGRGCLSLPLGLLSLGLMIAVFMESGDWVKSLGAGLGPVICAVVIVGFLMELAWTIYPRSSGRYKSWGAERRWKERQQRKGLWPWQ
jgi:hypothetical protein